MNPLQQQIEVDFEELFYEGEYNSTYCKKHKTYATPHEIKEFARYECDKRIELIEKDTIERVKEEMENHIVSGCVFWHDIKLILKKLLN